MANKGDIFARKDDGADKRGGGIELRNRQRVAAALCGNKDFRAWLYATLDDLSGFARDEGMLTDFGQGIRAAAARIQERLLVAREAVDALAEMHRNSLMADHERFAAAHRENGEEK